MEVIRMGQYFVIANLDKKEYINPHRMAFGAKLWEIAVNRIAAVFPFLLRQSSEGGGGDIDFDSKYAGRWAGDRIVVVGDYDDSGLYDFVKVSPEWKEISPEILDELNKFIGVKDMQIELMDI